VPGRALCRDSNYPVRPAETESLFYTFILLKKDCLPVACPKNGNRWKKFLLDRSSLCVLLNMQKVAIFYELKPTLADVDGGLFFCSFLVRRERLMIL
jgi:hypothetical protein